MNDDDGLLAQSTGINPGWKLVEKRMGRRGHSYCSPAKKMLPRNQGGAVFRSCRQSLIGNCIWWASITFEGEECLVAWRIARHGVST